MKFLKEHHPYWKKPFWLFFWAVMWNPMFEWMKFTNTFVAKLWHHFPERQTCEYNHWYLRLYIICHLFIYFSVYISVNLFPKGSRQKNLPIFVCFIFNFIIKKVFLWKIIFYSLLLYLHCCNIYLMTKKVTIVISSITSWWD